MKTHKLKGEEKGKIRNFIIVAVLLIILQGNADAVWTDEVPLVWIDSVDVIPAQPLEADMITFDISGGIVGSSSWVEYDEFLQDRASLRLDLYVNAGFFGATSHWTYSKPIGTLNAGDYRLEVNAIPYGDPNPSDTYTYIADFTVIPEPATILLLGIGAIVIQRSNRAR